MKINNVSLINLANNNTAPKIVRNNENHIQQQTNLMNGLNALSTMNQSLVSFKSDYIPPKHGVSSLDEAKERADIALQNSKSVKSQATDVIEDINGNIQVGKLLVDKIYEHARNLVDMQHSLIPSEKAVVLNSQDESQTKVLFVYDEEGNVSETVTYNPDTLDVFRYKKYEDDGSETKLVATHRGDVGLLVRNLFVGYRKDESGNISASKLYSFNNGKFEDYYDNYKKSSLGVVTSDLYAKKGIEFYQDYRNVPSFTLNGDDKTASMHCEYNSNLPNKVEIDYLSDSNGIHSSASYYFDEAGDLGSFNENNFKSKNPRNLIQKSIDEVIRYKKGQMYMYENAYAVDNKGNITPHSLFISDNIQE